MDKLFKICFNLKCVLLSAIHYILNISTLQGKGKTLFLYIVCEMDQKTTFMLMLKTSLLAHFPSMSTVPQIEDIDPV